MGRVIHLYYFFHFIHLFENLHINTINLKERSITQLVLLIYG